MMQPRTLCTVALAVAIALSGCEKKTQSAKEEAPAAQESPASPAAEPESVRAAAPDLTGTTAETREQRPDASQPAAGHASTDEGETGPEGQPATEKQAAPAGKAEELRARLEQIEAGKVDYPKRDADMRILKSFVESGKFDTAAYKADQIIEQQNNLRAAQGGNLPQNLQRKLDQIEAEKVAYPKRDTDMRILKSFVDQGKFDTAEYKADQIIEQQNNLRAAQGGNLPQNLQRKLDQIEAEKVDYPRRDTDMRILKSFVDKGKFDTAEYKADQIIEQQNNLRAAQGGNLPQNLQRKLDRIEAEKVDYPKRDADMRILRSFVDKGKFDTAEYKADQVIEQQNNLRAAQGGNLPQNLQRKLDQIEAEKVDYPKRDADMRILKSFVESGKFDTAEYKADQVIEQQRNLRGEQ